MGIKNWVLDTPPRLCQFHLYKGTEAIFACWATSAEMIVKWKNQNTFFARPKFESYLAPKNKAEYLNYILEWNFAWGFEPQNQGAFGVWSPETLATLLKDKVPLLCIGNFANGN
jgi:hypothetical protein